ncbi:type IV toxin-antitoxin system AbiEi family antitoxin [Quadrisphaera sp. KR29]|uniref:type IV toxin-antitoxin system AbiEi family antitoxin n=1 Tax=Quadrisphaera sp. KR29 TaxID=3461391 RepID=UPI004044CC09
MVARLVCLPEVLPPFTRRDLGRLGITRHQLDRLVTCGAVIEVVRGAYVDARAVSDPLSAAQAASLVLPPHVVACRALAAFVHGVDPRGPALDTSPVPLQGLVPASNRTPRWRGASIYEAPLAAHDVTEVSGVLVTTPERTALDCARYLSPPMALAVLDRMARLGLVDPEALRARIEEFRGDRGVGQARYLIAHADGRAESYGESWFRLRLVDAGFPRPELQIWVPEDRPGAVRLDLGWEGVRRAGEYDGEEFHSSRAQRGADDARRERLEREFGWRVLVARKGTVLGRSLELELAFGELLGMTPRIRRRVW